LFDFKGADMKFNRLTRVLILALSLAGVALSTGCNTVQGVGADIKAGGGAIERAAKS
jgi:predicted small secreted protein